MFALSLILSCGFLLFSAPSGMAKTRTAKSCSQADVAAAVAAATDGDSVAIPSCEKTIWTSSVTLPKDKSLVVQGAGIDRTKISNNASASSAFYLSIGAGKRVVLKDLTLTAEIGVDNGIRSAIITIDGNGGNTGRFEIYNIKFDSADQRAIITNTARGVVHDCIFNKMCNRQALMIQNVNWNGGGFGDGKWADKYDAFWGTEDAVFIEDNTFASDSSCNAATLSVVDCDSGGRFVFRYNTVTNSYITNHGVDTGGRKRSCLSGEIYQNTFSHTPNRGRWVDWRGGSLLAYDNNLTGFNSGVDLLLYRENTTGSCSLSTPCWATPCNEDTGPKYWCSNRQYSCTSAGGGPDQSICSALNPPEKCLGPIDDPSRDGKGYPCLDQPGQGAHALGASNLVPVYGWNNGKSIFSEYPFIVEGRDYYNCTNLEDARSQGLNYTPYIYPHPLRSESIPPPTNLRIVK